MNRLPRFAFLVLCVCAASAPVHLRAVPIPPATWSGLGGDANWMTPQNWVGNTAPVAGQELDFPDGASQLTNVNNFPAGTAFQSIQFTGTSGGYNLSGNDIALSVASIAASNTSGSQVIALNIQFTNPATISATSNGGVTLSGILSGSTDVAYSGNSQILVSGANSYTGKTTIALLSTVIVTNPTSLGTADGTAATNTTINGSLILDTTIGNEALVINAGGVLRGDNVFAGTGGPVNLPSGFARFIPFGVGSLLSMNGAISGSGGIQLESNGRVALTVTGNTFSGGVVWAAGSTATFKVGNDNVVPATTFFDIPSGATFDGSIYVQTIGGLSGAGTVKVGVELDVNQSTNTTFSGPILSSAGKVFVKLGNGTLTLTNNGTTQDNIQVFAGTLLVNANLPGTNLSVANSGNAVVGGTGTVGSVGLIGGTVSPGASPGLFTASALQFSGVTALQVELNGTTAGALYDQMSVSGAVIFGTTSLNVTLGFVPPPGTQFTIINKTGAGAVSGTFSGLPSGATFVVGSTTFSISYTGGDGNDVVLTALSGVPALPTMLWMVLALGLAGLGARQLMARRAAAASR